LTENGIRKINKSRFFLLTIGGSKWDKVVREVG